jgi:hypothetical protein
MKFHENPFGSFQDNIQRNTNDMAELIGDFFWLFIATATKLASCTKGTGSLSPRGEVARVWHWPPVMQVKKE